MAGNESEAPVSVLTSEIVAAAARRPQASDRKARIGVIGVGWWATSNHIPVLRLRRDVELVCGCGLDPATNERIRNDFGFGSMTTDHEELLQHDLDAVVVSSPHPWHGRHAIAALTAGRHVYVEKPFATKVAEAREIVRLAEEKNLHVVVSLGWHSRPLIAKARQLMAKGLAGEVE